MHRSLVSLAVVTAMWDQRRHDYLDNFVPFIATLLEARPRRRIERDDVHDLCGQFEDEFGLRLPFHPMTAVLNRCVRRRMMRRSGGGYAVDTAVVATLSFAGEREAYNRRERELLGQFIAYAQQEFGKTIDVEDIEMTLLDFLHRFDMEVVISNRGTQSALPERTKGKRNRPLLYMLSRFAIDAQNSSPIIFRTLCDMALGHMITAAVLLDGYDWPSDTVRNSNVYLDAPIILRLIGTNGESQASVFAEFVSELRAKGAKMWVFEHSKQEAMQILEGARRWVGSPSFDPNLASRTALFFKQEGYTDSEIERIILRVDGMLDRHGIGVFDTHPYMERREHQLDEVALRGVIEQCYGESDWGFDREIHADRIQKDVASIAAVYRLRVGKRPRLLRDAEHIFVSINGALSRASRSALNGDRTTQELPACVTDVFVGTIMWMNSPREAKEASRKRLIADCHAAIRPDAALEAAIAREARRLRDQGEINEDDYLLLTTSFVTKNLLAATTLNDLEAFDSSTSFEILERIKQRLRKEERDNRVKVELQRDRESRAREMAEDERDKASKAIAQAADDYARRRAMIVSVLITIGIVTVLLLPVVGAILIHPALVAITVVAVLIQGYLSHVNGFTLRKSYRSLCDKYREEYRSRYFGG